MASEEELQRIHPLKLDDATKEPYLRLQPPYEHLVLTPPRHSDASSLVRNLNDPRIFATLSGPPYPYTEAHAIEWLNEIVASSEAAYADLRAGKDVVGAVVVRYLRDTSLSGGSIASAPLIGDCWFYRHPFTDLINRELGARLARENAAKATGDPTIAWTVGGASAVRA